MLGLGLGVGQGSARLIKAQQARGGWAGLRACVGRWSRLDGGCRAEEQHEVLEGDDATAAAAAAAAAFGQVQHCLHLTLGGAQPETSGDELGDVCA